MNLKIIKMELRNKVNTQIELSKEKKEEYCKAVWKINMMLSYPMTDGMIESIVSNILRLRPETTINDLNNVIDDFLTNKREYIASKGISNIFRELEKLNESKKDIPPFEFDFEEHGGDMRLFEQLKKEHELKYS